MKKIAAAAILFSTIGLLALSGHLSNDDFDPGSNVGKESYSPIVVMELFTSQGCSSCPAADRLLNEIRKVADKNVITLSYHVDYWNYIGWEDPFSSSDFAVKQSLYNVKFNSQGNYTPQLVINGKEHFVGSDRALVLSKISNYKEQPALNEVLLYEVKKDRDLVSFGFRIEGDIKNKSIKALLVLDERTTLVKRGENRNKLLVNSNIVLFEKIENLHSNTGNMMIEIPGSINSAEAMHLVVLIENEIYDISAAANMIL